MSGRLGPLHVSLGCEDAEHGLALGGGGADGRALPGEDLQADVRVGEAIDDGGAADSHAGHNAVGCDCVDPALDRLSHHRHGATYLNVCRGSERSRRLPLRSPSNGPPAHTMRPPTLQASRMHSARCGSSDLPIALRSRRPCGEHRRATFEHRRSSPAGWCTTVDPSLGWLGRQCGDCSK